MSKMNPMKKVLILIAGIVLSIMMNGQPLVLTGKIGASPVIMQLNVVDDSTVEGSYFYVKYRKTIALNGKKNRQGIILTSSFASEQDKPDAETIELENAGPEYIGRWSLDKKKLRVELNPIDIEKYRNPYDEMEFVKDLKKENPYQYALMSAFVFNKDSSTVHAGYKIDWYKEKYTMVPMVQLRNDNNSAAITKINERLRMNSLQTCIDESFCGESAKDYSYSSTVQSLFIDGDVVSINTCINYYCGGAYPDAGCEGQTLSLKTGDPVHLADVLWFNKDMAAPTVTADWNTYEDTVFTASIVKLFETLYPAEVKDVGGSCEYYDPSVWRYVNWYFTGKGLYIGPVYPHYGLACSQPEWSVIPYTDLKKYRNPKKQIKLPGD
jgi:hypothetical protein